MLLLASEPQIRHITLDLKPGSRCETFIDPFCLSAFTPLVLCCMPVIHTRYSLRQMYVLTSQEIVDLIGGMHPGNICWFSRMQQQLTTQRA